MTWKTNKQENLKGGDGGQIFIFTDKLSGNGSMSVDGGGGSIGGNAGKIQIESKKNNYRGSLSANGGKSVIQKKKWWEKTWIQIIMLLGALASLIGLFFIFS